MASVETCGLLVPADRIARVIGKAGAGLKQIREMTGCKVQVQQSADPNALSDPQRSRRVDLAGAIDQLVGGLAMVLAKAWLGEQNCTPTFMIPAEKAGLVVGRGGENLKRVREECRVRILLEREPVVDPTSQAEERMLTMHGEIAQVAQALRYAFGASGHPMHLGPLAGRSPGLMVPPHSPMEALLAGSLGGDMSRPRGLGASLSGHSQVRGPSADPDEMQLHMLVPERFAGAILGKGGALMKQTATSSACRVSMSSRDGGVDRRVVILGNAQQCAMAQSLIHEQLVEASAVAGAEFSGDVTAMLFIRKEAAGAVIGKQGAGLKQVREQSGAKIQLARDEVEGQRPCTISGGLAQVLKAEELIFNLARAVPVEANGGGGGGGGYPGMPMGLGFDGGFKSFGGGVDESDQTTKILVPAQAAGAIIGKQGSGLRQIRETYGVQVDMLQPAQAPQWPNERVVIFKGPTSARGQAVDAVLRVSFQMYGEAASLRMLVPSTQVGGIIGKAGNTLRTIREQCGITTTVDREEIMGERLVIAVGPQAAVSTAATAIISILENSGAPAMAAREQPTGQPAMPQAPAQAMPPQVQSLPVYPGPPQPQAPWY